MYGHHLIEADFAIHIKFIILRVKAERRNKNYIQGTDNK